MKTRQAVLVEPRRFEIQETEIELPDEYVMVKMAGCGMCTWELNHWAGRIGTPPMALGHEAWGEVVEVGKNTTGRVRVGDRVTGLAGKSFADTYVLIEKHAMRITHPEQIDIPGEPLYCVQNVIRAAHPSVGETVAVVGCGPMGLWATQGLACPQLKHLVAIDIVDAKLELAKSFGATHTVNPKHTDPAEFIKGINEDRLADVVVEGTGSPAGVQVAIDILQPRHPKLVVMSSFKGKGEIDFVQLCGKAIEVYHAHPGIARHLDEGVRRDEVLINNRVYKTDGVISHRFPLDDIQKTFELFESNRPADYLKGIVVP